MKKLLTMIAALGIIGAYAIPTFAQPNKPAKIDVCHVTGNGSYHLINVSERAWPAHEGHGDAKPGDAVPGSDELVFNEHCEMELDITTSTVEGWPVLADTEDFGELNWQAEGKFGNNSETGDWELGVGNNTQLLGEFDQAQHEWGPSPVTEDFTVEYDATTGTATFTVNGDSTDYMVGTDSAENLYFVARASDGTGDYVTLSNLMLNGYAVGEDITAEDGNVESLKIEGFDVNSDFTATGTVEMEYSDTALAAPAFQLQVSSGI